MTRHALAHIFAAGTFIVALALVLAIIGEIALQSKTTTAITGQVVQEGVHPTGYAAPWDAFSPGTQLADISVQQDSSTQFTATVDVNHAGGFVWHQGYYLYEGTWHQFTFPGASGTWLRDSASYDLTALYDDFLAFGDDDLYVAFYSCKKQNNVWECGCRDTTCDQSYWMVQSVNIREPAGGQFIEMTPREQVIPANTDFSVDLVIGGANTDVYGYDLDVAFDPSVITFVGIEHGNFLGDVGYPGNSTPADHLCVNIDTSVSGLIQDIACTRIGTGPFETPSGNILRTLNFRTLSTTEAYSRINIDTSTVQIADWGDVADPDSDPVITVWPSNDAAVIVRN